MCGRYIITTPSEILAKYFKATLPNGPIPIRNNAAPSQMLPVILEDEPNQIVMAHWGYPIHLGKGEKELINIRAESIAEKPFFKKAAQKHRCIILADGFYEWKKELGKNQPYKFTVSHSPIAFAGVFKWQQKKLTDEMLPFFSIITVPANEFMTSIHDRMPVILPEGNEKVWLEKPFSLDELHPFKGKMTANAVSTLLNNAKNENVPI
jgi:putative SOS response-associated peptidase YedK